MYGISVTMMSKKALLCFLRTTNPLNRKFRYKDFCFRFLLNWHYNIYSEQFKKHIYPKT